MNEILFRPIKVNLPDHLDMIRTHGADSDTVVSTTLVVGETCVRYTQGNQTALLSWFMLDLETADRLYSLRDLYVIDLEDNAQQRPRTLANGQPVPAFVPVHVKIRLRKLAAVDLDHLREDLDPVFEQMTVALGEIEFIKAVAP